MLDVLRDLVAFQSSALVKICIELGLASKSNVEANRQEMARSADQQEESVAPGPRLAAIVARLRDAIQLIGRPAEVCAIQRPQEMYCTDLICCVISRRRACRGLSKSSVAANPRTWTSSRPWI